MDAPRTKTPWWASTASSASPIAAIALAAAEGSFTAPPYSSTSAVVPPPRTAALVVPAGQAAEVGPHRAPPGVVVDGHLHLGPGPVQLEVQGDAERDRPVALDDVALEVDPDHVFGPELVPGQQPGVAEQGAVALVDRDVAGQVVVVALPPQGPGEQHHLGADVQLGQQPVGGRFEIHGSGSSLDSPPVGVRLEGKVAIVTGAARGQGEAEARLFAAEGAQVVLTDVLTAEVEAVATDLGDSAIALTHDVSDVEAWSTVVATTVEHFGGLDVLVNNAGIHWIRALVDEDPAALERLLRVNLVGPFVGMQAVVEPMRARGGGSIVNISSFAGLSGAWGHSAYGASKWGLRGITKTAVDRARAARDPGQLRAPRPDRHRHAAGARRRPDVHRLPARAGGHR